MKDEKYNRNVSMLCPTCGCSQFEFENGAAETIEIFECASCGRTLTKEELIKENSENLNEHVKEIGNQVTKDLAKEMKKSLKTIFKGNKNFRIK